MGSLSERVILSVTALIITNLIVGSITLSLGVIVAIVLGGVAAVAVVLLAVVGFCTVLERAGWLRTGWSDEQIQRVRAWAMGTWQDMPAWFRREKRKILGLLIDMLKGRQEQPDTGTQGWKSIGIGLIIILAVVLAKHSLRISAGAAVLVVTVGALVIVLPALYFLNRKSREDLAETPPEKKPEVQRPAQVELPAMARSSTALKDAAVIEMAEMLDYLLRAYRTGQLRSLVEPEPGRSNAERPGARRM
jgi:hypothetical protein